MDKNFQQSIRQQYNSTWLLHSFPHTSSTHDITNTNHSLLNRTIAIDRQSDTRPFTQVSNRPSNRRSSTNSRILQLDLCHFKKERQNQTSLQPETPQSISRSTALQDGNNQGSGLLITQKRLLSLRRSLRHIPTYPSSPRLPQVSSFQVEIASLPIYDYTLWIGSGSLPLYQNLSTNPRMDTDSGYRSLRLFGRLDTRSRIQDVGTSTNQHAYATTATARLDSEHQEISSIADTQARISRLLLGCYDYDSRTTSKENPRSSTLHQASYQQASLTNTSADTQPDNEDSSSYLCGLSSPTLHSSSSMVQEQASQDRQGLGPSGTTGSSELGRAQVVVCEPTEVEWPFDAASYPQRNDLRRRKQHWLEVQLETLSDASLLDSSRSSTVNQLERTEGSTTSTADFPIIEERNSPHPHRQHHQLVIYQQAGRYPLSTSDGTGVYNTISLYKLNMFKEFTTRLQIWNLDARSPRTYGKSNHKYSNG